MHLQRCEHLCDPRYRNPQLFSLRRLLSYCAVKFHGLVQLLSHYYAFLVIESVDSLTEFLLAFLRSDELSLLRM